jgi:hypothetical protein
MVRYTCMRAMLPTIEAALAAHGYILERPLANEVNGERKIIMTHQSAIVLLSECAQRELADIIVSGATQAAATALLDQLPLDLAKLPAQHGMIDRHY